MKDILLVSFGSVLGANIRYIILKKIEKINLTNHIGIVIINSFASFLLGFFLSILPRIGSDEFSYQLALFFLIGLLGSLSTFSTFIFDLFNFCLQFKILRALKLFLISISMGIIALAFGIFLGNQ